MAERPEKDMGEEPAAEARELREDESFKEALRHWEELAEPLIEEIRESERLTESDFAIRINAT
jgi:DNA-binding transcriptional regulator YiaG